MPLGKLKLAKEHINASRFEEATCVLYELVSKDEVHLAPRTSPEYQLYKECALHRAYNDWLMLPARNDFLKELQRGQEPRS